MIFQWGIRHLEHLEGEEEEESMARRFAWNEPKGLWPAKDFSSSLFLFTHNLVLQDLAIPATMDRVRILKLAHERKLKKAVEAAINEASFVGTENPREAAISVDSVAEKRPLEQVKKETEDHPSNPVKRQKQGSNMSGVSLVDEPTDDEAEGHLIDLTDTDPKADPVRPKAGGNPGGSLRVPQTGDPLATERCTLLKLRSGQGWLSQDSNAPPLEALGEFPLSPDKKKLEGTLDEDAFLQAKEALGVLGSRVLDVIERAEKSKERAQWEHRRDVIEKSAKETTLQKANEAAEKEETLTKELSAKDKELRTLRASLNEFEESLEIDKATSASLQMKMSNLRETGAKCEAELQKATKARAKCEAEL